LYRSLTIRQRSCVRRLRQQLHRFWALGRNVILTWCRDESGLSVLVVPHYQLATFVETHYLAPTETPTYRGDVAVAGMSSKKFATNLLTGTRKASPQQITMVARLLGIVPTRVPIADPEALASLDPLIIDLLIKRYSPSYVENRAVALIDIVKFSLHTPLEQMTFLNSLVYSFNSAHSKLLQKRIDVDFARSTTGDGFYIWNRDTGPQANLHLYHMLQLALADNAIAQSKGTTAPRLKAAFHIGNCYEFFQYEALQPTPFNYIVGDVTIDLARLIEAARPGQILIGNFRTEFLDPNDENVEPMNLGAPRFIHRLQGSLSDLHGVRLSGQEIESIRCYLSGSRVDGDQYDITRLKLTDKHGISRIAYNAKINIYRRRGDPIYLGLQHAELMGEGEQR